MAVSVKLAGVDYEGLSAFSLTEQAGAVATTKVSVLVGEGQVPPRAMMSVEVFLGADKIFHGVVRAVDPPEYSTTFEAPVYALTVSSLEVVLNWRMVTRTWYNKSYTEILQDLFDDFLAEENLTLGGISTIPGVVKRFAVADKKIFDVLKDISDRVGASSFWITPTKEFFFQVATEFEAATVPEKLTTVRLVEDVADFRTVQRVRGATSRITGESTNTLVLAEVAALSGLSGKIEQVTTDSGIYNPGAAEDLAEDLLGTFAETEKTLSLTCHDLAATERYKAWTFVDEAPGVEGVYVVVERTLTHQVDDSVVIRTKLKNRGFFQRYGYAMKSAAVTAGDAIAGIGDIASDGKLTPVEKTSARASWSAVAGEVADMVALADLYDQDAEEVAYLEAFHFLADYLNGGVTWVSGTPVWLGDEATETQDIDPDEYRGAWDGYFAARLALTSASYAAAKQYVNDQVEAVIVAGVPGFKGSGTTLPGSGVVGDTFVLLDTGTLDGHFYRYDGTAWQYVAMPSDAQISEAMSAILALDTLNGTVVQQLAFVGRLFGVFAQFFSIQFRDAVASTAAGEETPSLGDQLIYMGKDPRIAGTRPYEFALKEYVGNGGKEEWIVHLITKMLANGMLALTLSGCVQAPTILSNPGRIWTQASITFGAASVNDMDVHGDTLVIVGNLGNLNRSTNAGRTWGIATHGHGTSHLTGVAYDDVSGKWAICGASGKFSISTDDGATFGSLISTPFAGAIANVDGGNGKFVLTGSSGQVAVYDIATGTMGALLTTPIGASSVDFARYGNGVWLVGGSGGKLVRSTDNLLTFSSLLTTPFGANSIVDIDYESGAWVAVGLAGRLMRSEDGGQNWGSLISTPITSSGFGVVVVSPAMTVAAGDQGRVIVSKDLGQTWIEPGTAATYQPVGGSGSFLCGAATGDGGAFVLGGVFSSGGCIIRSEALDAGAGIVNKEVDANGRTKVTFSEGTVAYSEIIGRVLDRRDTTGTVDRTETVLPLAIGQTADILWVLRITGGTTRTITFALPAGGTYEVIISGNLLSANTLVYTDNGSDVLSSYGNVAGGTSVTKGVGSGQSLHLSGLVKRIS